MLAYISTATDNATAVSVQSTTVTDQTKFVDTKAAAYTYVRITGTLVVNAAGNLAVQCAQNAAHADTTTILAGSYADVSRIL